MPPQTTTQRVDGTPITIRYGRYFIYRPPCATEGRWIWNRRPRCTDSDSSQSERGVSSPHPLVEAGIPRRCLAGGLPDTGRQPPPARVERYRRRLLPPPWHSPACGGVIGDGAHRPCASCDGRNAMAAGHLLARCRAATLLDGLACPLSARRRVDSPPAGARRSRRRS